MNYFIPVLDENGCCKIDKESEVISIQNGIQTNNLSSKRDCIRMIGLISKYLEINEPTVGDLLLKKMRYLGFSAEKISVQNDMAPKEMNKALASNFLLYYLCNTDDNLYNLKEILEKLRRI